MEKRSRNVTEGDLSCLKALDTLGNCQKSVFSFGVFQHVCIKTQICESFRPDLLSKLQENSKRKNMRLKIVWFQMPKNDFRFEVG